MIHNSVIFHCFLENFPHSLLTTLHGASVTDSRQYLLAMSNVLLSFVMTASHTFHHVSFVVQDNCRTLIRGLTFSGIPSAYHTVVIFYIMHVSIKIKILKVNFNFYSHVMVPRVVDL